jgi:signal transduction histidine kinase
LRTPLQAFLSEVEILRTNIEERMGGEEAGSLLRSIKQLDLIGVFMNMTINRSIDFTKASSGIKLNPSIESTDFSEALAWAAGCMTTSHSSVPIVFAPMAKSIHHQIYTDKQWLMENTLCLLSNALKFTTEGEITIRYSLETSPPVVDAAHCLSAAGAGGGGAGAGGVDNAAENGGRERDIELGVPVSVSVERGGGGPESAAAPMLRVEVEDTGIGIAQEHRQHLFKPFMQVCNLLTHSLTC